MKTAESNQLKQVSLYEKRKKIQARWIGGTYQRIRKLTIWITLSWFFFAPWVTWGKRQAIWFDLPGRKFYIFDYTFWPQDLIFLTGALILAALGLFFFTTLFGRLWCGYTCPQTVWTKLYMHIEEFCEGTRAQRLKLDQAPWSLSKLFKRSAKHFLWLLLAFATAFTFVGYFYPVHSLSYDLTRLDWTFWQCFWVGLFTFATYLNAGFMREQVCMYMCPYARFQSVMFDTDSLIISYDVERGEPRGPRSGPRQNKNVAPTALGDCIDCGLCVQVCPTGIDIRDGLQMACIACACCVDACNHVMEKIGKPHGLVRYTTENILAKKRYRLFRPRSVAYAAVILILITVLGYALIERMPLAVDIIRERAQLFRETVDGDIENIYTIQIMNKTQKTRAYKIRVEGFRGLKFVGKSVVLAEPGELTSVPIRLKAEVETIKSDKNPVVVVVQDKDNEKVYVKEKTSFIYKHQQ